VADYLEFSVRAEYADATTAIYVEIGSLGMVRVELSDGDSPEITASLMAKVAKLSASRSMNDPTDWNSWREQRDYWRDLAATWSAQGATHQATIARLESELQQRRERPPVPTGA
jgi:hypothetical protein